MRLLLAAATAIALSGSAAFAWGDMYMGDPTNDPNSNFLQHMVVAPNYCPAGLQPVLVGGVVCCGTPNAGLYVDRPGKVYRKPAPRAYAPVGVKGVAPVGEKGVVYR
jgi:hypothetical protein